MKSVFMFFMTMVIVLMFILLVIAIANEGVSGMVEDFLDALDKIREYKKGKRKRKKEG